MFPDWLTQWLLDGIVFLLVGAAIMNGVFYIVIILAAGHYTSDRKIEKDNDNG
jgi:hypothetical protein